MLPAAIQQEIFTTGARNDLIGFHTERWRSAFAASTEAVLGPDPGRARAPSLRLSRSTWRSSRRGRERRSARARARARRPKAGVARTRVDRADPAKNAVRGFLAFERLLDAGPTCTAASGWSRCSTRRGSGFPEYRDCRAEIEATAERVNRRFATVGWQPLVLDVRDDFPLSVAAYKQYDVLLVNSVRDGLNLVAKEGPLVNTRCGSPVLSRDAGAFEELGEWVVPIDPEDVEAQADALELALDLPEPERRRRLEAIRSWVREHDLDAWSARLLEALEASTMRR